jgi:hypothetical protein
MHVAHAAARLGECLARSAGGAPDLRALSAEVEALAAGLDTRAAPRTREAIEEGFDLAHRAARAVAQACGASTPADRATLLIARRYGLDGP